MGNIETIEADMQQRRRRPTADHSSILERALLEALREVVEESNSDSSGGITQVMKEHGWDPEDCSSNFRVLANGVTARRGAEQMTTDAIRGKKAYRVGKHTWEIEWPTDERGSHACIGVATPQASLRCIGYTALLGSDDESWGWNIVDKTLWHGGKKIGLYPQDRSFEVPKSIFVHLDTVEGQLSFSTKDQNLGIAFSGLPSGRIAAFKPCCAAASATRGNCDITMKYVEKIEHITSLPIQPCLPEGYNEEDDVPYHFHPNCGDNIDVMFGGRRARWRSAYENFTNGVVLTREPLKDNVMFEIRLDSKVSRWMGSLEIGIASCGSSDFVFPKTLSTMRGDKYTWAWTDTKVVRDGEKMKDLGFDLDKMAVGDKVGIMKKGQTILFFANGKELGGLTCKNLPLKVFGATDIYGRAEQVSITESSVSRGGLSRQRSVGGGPAKAEVESNDPLSVMLRMKNTTDFLKTSSHDSSEATRKVALTILQPFHQTQDKDLRRKFGDHLADLGAARELTRLFESLTNAGIERQSVYSDMKIILSTLWNYSDVSIQFGRGLGESGLFLQILDDLKRLGTATITGEKKKFLVYSKMSILHNCAKVAENKNKFHRYEAANIIRSFTKLDNTEIAATALLTLSYIIEEHKIDQCEGDDKAIGYIVDLLNKAISDDSLVASTEDSSFSALELVMGMGNIAANDRNRVKMVNKGVIQPLIDLIGKGGETEQECAVNTIWSLSHNLAIKAHLQKQPAVLRILEKLEKSSSEAIRSASKRALLQIKHVGLPKATIQGETVTKSCEYCKVCKNFKISQSLDDIFFEEKFDMCFCNSCHNGRGDQLSYTRGDPGKKYGVPIGWFRFSLKIPNRATALEVFSKWHVGFHGTKVESLRPILLNGILLLPGDVALGGSKLDIRPGHFTDDRKPTGFNIRQIFVSPSIRYSGVDTYAVPSSFQDPETKKRYKVKVAFQVVIRPDCYVVGPETIGARDKTIDPLFSNEELEWSTKERTSIIPYGLLVKLEEI